MYWQKWLAACAVAASMGAAAAPGDHYEISPAALAAPGSTHPDDISPEFFHPASLALKAPAGFTVAPFASHLEHARWLAVAPNGDVFLSEQGPGKILVLRGGAEATTVTTFASGFAGPHGMAFHDGALYVADTRAVWRLPYHDGDEALKGEPVRVTKAPDLRPQGWHTTREIVFDRAGRLYLGIGAASDVTDTDPPPDATIQLVNPDGTMIQFAGGLRNVAGMAIYPGTDDLWGTVNERDKLGARVPPDYLAQIGQGDFFGWPYAYDGPHADPQFGAKRPDLVAKTKTPEVLFEAHSAPLGLVFYDGTQFPAAYRGDAFVAFHATGPYDAPDGYKVVRVHFAGGKPVGGYEDFVTGFWDQTKPVKVESGLLAPTVWGTPCGLAVAKDGSLLIADDLGGTIWRVSYTGK